MNLPLLESFGQNFPEEFDGSLDCVSIAVTCAFNRRGTLLAVGCNDGRLVVWDFLTRGIAKVISAHVHPICSISWSRNGRKILSSSTDNIVCIWDVWSGECDKTFRFPSPILRVQYHPRDSTKFLVCPLKHASILMDVEGNHSVIPLDEESDLNIIASFDRRGQYVYTGNARGRVLVFETTKVGTNKKPVATFRVTTGTANTTVIKSLEFARRGGCFLVNTADRIIRVYESAEVLACGMEGEPEPIQKLQDLVNKTPWKKCCFSGDGEYVCAGSARQHSLYIWEKSNGSLVKILPGTKGEMLLDVVWHPVRPVLASISSGVVSIWAQNHVENWSAFAPDFKELDENVEYEERESEFDIEDEDKKVEEMKGQDEEDEEVDILKTEPIVAFMSSDEEVEDEEALVFLPVAPDIDEPEDGAVPSAGEAGADEAGDKRRSSNKEPTPPKKKKIKTIDIELPDAPFEEIHPLLSVRKGQEHRPPRKSSRPKTSKSKQDPRKKAKGAGPPMSFI